MKNDLKMFCLEDTSRIKRRKKKKKRRQAKIGLDTVPYLPYMKSNGRRWNNSSQSTADTIKKYYHYYFLKKYYIIYLLF